MRTSRHIPLVKYIRRTLVARLATMAAVIALVMAVLAYMAEERVLEREVVIEAQAGLGDLAERATAIMYYETLPAGAAFRKAVAELAAARRYIRHGKVVFARFGGRDAGDAEEYLDQSYVLHQAVSEYARAGGRPAPDEAWSRTVIIADVLSVHAVTPLKDTDGNIVGQAEIVFVPAPAVLASMQRKAAYTAGIVILITLATTSLLYPVVLRLTNRLAAFSRNLQAANFETLSLVGCVVAKRDSDTDDHNYRVTLYALRMGETLSLTTAQMRALTKGAFLHDVGKIAIRDDILLKPGRLTPEEFEIMKTHVGHGLDVIDRSTWLRDAQDVVGGHHEKFDGRGYPAGLEGEEIPLTARIFSVADVFDALTSSRPYKPPLSCREAMQVLRRDRGNHFDPEIVDLFSGMAAELHERYAHKTGSDLKVELIDMSWRYFQTDAETLI